jgi:hypothetical protein
MERTLAIGSNTGRPFTRADAIDWQLVPLVLLPYRVIRTMHQRASFLCNPRFRGDAEPHGPRHRARAGAGGSPPIAGNSATARARRSSAAAVAIAQVAGNKTVPGAGKEVAWLRAEPPEVVFEAYEAGQVLSATVQLRNTGNVTRGLRLLPPASQYFQASLPR